MLYFSMETKVELQQKIISQDREIKRLEEENHLLRKALFAPKSEKRKCNEPSSQLPLFDMPENPPEEDVEEKEEIVVEKHSRKKRGRKPLPDDLPRIDIIHDIPEEEKQCDCGCKLTRIGEEVSEKLDTIPETIRVIRHIRPKYGCKCCEGAFSDNKSVKIAPPPPQIIPKGLPTASLLARSLTAKFCDALPFYRQVKQFNRIGVEITRQSLCNWAMKTADSCRLLLDLLIDEIRGGPLINADETTVQVLDEPGRKATDKSYMWVFRGGAPENPVVIYHYAQGRNGDVAKMFLDKYQGVVQTDGYKGYGFLDNQIDILHVGCWAHARRKFVEAESAGSKKTNKRINKALSFIRKLYRLEKQAKDDKLEADGIYAMRQQYAKPILDEMKQWLNERAAKVAPQSLFGKAVSYCLNQWHRLEKYADDGHARIDNNVAENAIRPFVIGRKNWLFSGSPAGARASALLYSLIETAKANSLEPYAYLRFLFEKLPITPEVKYKNLLPTSLSQNDLILPVEPTGV